MVWLASQGQNHSVEIQMYSLLQNVDGTESNLCSLVAPHAQSRLTGRFEDRTAAARLCAAKTLLPLNRS